NRTIGALTRNVGEVLGVFGEVEIPPAGMGGGLRGYDSSVRITDLTHTEDLIRKLQSPLWPKEFPPIDEEMRKEGEKLFVTYCQQCHAPIDRTDPNRVVKAVRTPLGEKGIGTDPMMAENVNNRKGK